eukprot:89817-Chlamydomonas_euryale.AAC.1
MISWVKKKAGDVGGAAASGASSAALAAADRLTPHHLRDPGVPCDVGGAGDGSNGAGGRSAAVTSPLAASALYLGSSGLPASADAVAYDSLQRMLAVRGSGRGRAGDRKEGEEKRGLDMQHSPCMLCCIHSGPQCPQAVLTWGATQHPRSHPPAPSMHATRGRKGRRRRMRVWSCTPRCACACLVLLTLALVRACIVALPVHVYARHAALPSH